MDPLTYRMSNIHFSSHVKLLLSLDMPTLYHSRVLRGIMDHHIGQKSKYTRELDIPSSIFKPTSIRYKQTPV